MRHPHHLPPNLFTSGPTMGVLIPPEPLQRTCMELGVCQGDGRCHGCAPVEPMEPAPPRASRFGFAITIAALTGISAGVAIGAARWLLSLL